MVAALAIPLATTLGISTTAATFITSATLYIGTTAASLLIQQANQPKQDIGTKLSAASGGAVNQSIIAGPKETAGSLLYAGSWGQPGKTPNGLYVRVFCLQDMPSTDYSSRCWTSDNKGTLDKDHINYTTDLDHDYPADGSGYGGGGYSIGHPITSLDHDGNHYGWVKILDGSQVAADPYLMAKFGMISDRPWTSSMIGRGRTIMIVTQRYTVKEANEVKNVVAVLDGMAFYDWRKDSTNGGSGSHRWDDQSTYEYSANPFVVLYNIMRGIYYGDTWLYGGHNWPARRFDNDTWTAAANVADQDVTLASTDTENRYRMGAEINLGEAPLTVIDRILATASGRLVESGGIYKVYAGGIGASVYSFADDDIIITEQLTTTMFPSREDICNTITGTYCEPSNGGQMKAYTKRTKAEYVANDNGETRSKSMDLDYVRSNTQAQRLALHALNDNRRFMTKVVAFPSVGRKIEPGDPVNWSDSVRFGFTNKKFIVGDVTLTNRGVVLGVLREADATDADWSVSDESPYTVGVYGDIVPDSQTIDITVTPTAIKKGDGSDKDPALKITWPTDADMVDCKWVRLQVRILDVANSTFSTEPVRFDEGVAIITKGIRLNEVYEVRAKIIPYSDRDTDWCDWVEVTASVGHGVSVDDVEDEAPPELSVPTVVRRTTVVVDGRVLIQYKIQFDDTGDSGWSYQVRIANSDTGDVDWRPTKQSPILYEMQALNGYDIRVRAVSKLGIPGDISDVRHVDVPKKTTSDSDVPAITGFTATGGKVGLIRLEWDRPTYADHDYVEIRETASDTDGPGAASYLNAASGDHFKRQGLGNGVDRYYFTRPIDTSGNPGPWTPSSAPGRHGKTARLQSDDVDDLEIKNSNLDTDAVTEKKAKVNSFVNKASGIMVSGTLNRTHTGKQVVTGLFQNGADVITEGGVKKCSIRNPNPSPIFVGYDIKISLTVTGYDDGTGQTVARLNKGSITLALIDDTNKKTYAIATITSDGKKGGVAKRLKGSFFTTKIKAADTNFLCKVVLTFQQQGGLSGYATGVARGTFTFIDWKR